ncbi:MAG: tripartite tricarboxylate transporter substrate binding protein [Variovorax sp.]|nr:MAG: tripartite tricarboxylate transporter substrate binding protein [Variovorax sp.]
MTPLHSKRTFCHVLLATATALAALPSAAQSYPDKPIRMLVGFPAGGGVDIVARLLAVEMQKTLGQPITVDNRAGAAGNIATEAVARAAPDGYTILMGNTGSLAINPALYTKLSFNVLKDLKPVALVSTSPLLVLVNPSQPAKTLGELVANAKQQKGQLNYGTGGAGSISHLAMELLKSETGADLVHVPYRGGAPAVTDLLGNQLQVVVEGVPIAAPFLKSGKLNALAVTSTRRSPAVPDVPTGAEAGFPNFTATAWYGVMVPAGTPAPVIAKLNAAANAALKDPGLLEKLALQGSEPAGGTPAAFDDHLQKEVTRWAAAVKTSGAKVD